MSDSLTWQFLPATLLQPLLDQHLTLAEAAELWDLALMGRPLCNHLLPRHLRAAGQKLDLLELEPPTGTRQ